MSVRVYSGIRGLPLSSKCPAVRTNPPPFMSGDLGTVSAPIRKYERSLRLRTDRTERGIFLRSIGLLVLKFYY